MDILAILPLDILAYLLFYINFIPNCFSKNYNISGNVGYLTWSLNNTRNGPSQNKESLLMMLLDNHFWQ